MNGISEPPSRGAVPRSPPHAAPGWARGALFLCGLAPAVGLILGGLTHGLGANPIEYLIRTSGDWTLRWLLITLAITPLRQLSGWDWLLSLRRMAGWFGFFYAFVHVSGYVILDRFFAWDQILGDILKRPYITVGLGAFMLLLPLAITSTAGWRRRLGGERWRRLHQLIYPATGLGAAHFFMMTKADLRAPLLHAAVFAILLGWRAWNGVRLKGGEP